MTTTTKAHTAMMMRAMMTMMTVVVRMPITNQE